MKNFVITILAAFAVLFCIVYACSSYASGKTYKTSEIEVKKISGSWVSCKKGTNTKVDYTGVAKNEYGWWRVYKGQVDFTANGIYQNDYGWWKTTNGKVTFDETGIYQNEHGWWRTEDSKVNFQANSIYQNIHGWWKTTNGKVTFKDHGIYQNEHGWWKVEDSKVNFNYNGLASNEHGTWVIVNGKVDFSYSGLFTFRGVTYSIDGGKVQKVISQCNKNMLFLGDSISSGYMLHGDKVNNVSESYPIKASKLLNCNITSFARAGESYYKRPNEFCIAEYFQNNDVYKYDVVIIDAGINDYFSNHSMSNMNEALDVICSKLNSANQRRLSSGKSPMIVIIYKIGFVFNHGDNSLGYSIADYNSKISSIIDANLNMEHYILTSGVLNSKTYQSYTVDNIHPNQKGVQNQTIAFIEDLYRLKIA